MQCTVFLLNSPPPDSVRTVVTMNLYEAIDEKNMATPQTLDSWTYKFSLQPKKWRHYSSTKKRTFAAYVLENVDVAMALWLYDHVATRLFLIRY